MEASQAGVEQRRDINWGAFKAPYSQPTDGR